MTKEVPLIINISPLDRVITIYFGLFAGLMGIGFWLFNPGEGNVPLIGGSSITLLSIGLLLWITESEIIIDKEADRGIIKYRRKIYPRTFQFKLSDIADVRLDGNVREDGANSPSRDPKLRVLIELKNGDVIPVINYWSSDIEQMNDCYQQLIVYKQT